MKINLQITDNKHLRYLIWGGLSFLLFGFAIIMKGPSDKVPSEQVSVKSEIKEDFSTCDNNYYIVDKTAHLEFIEKLNPQGLKSVLKEMLFANTPRVELFVVAYAKLHAVHLNRDINGAVNIFDQLASDSKADYYVSSRIEAAIIRQVCSEEPWHKGLYADFEFGVEHKDIRAGYFKYLYDTQKFGKNISVAVEELVSLSYQSFYPAMLEIYFQIYRDQQWRPIFDQQLLSSGVFDGCSHVLFYLVTINPFLSLSESMQRLDFINTVKPDFLSRCDVER